MIHVVATIELRPGARAQFLEEFTRLVPDVRAEPGCIEYGGAVDVPSGLPVQPPVRLDVVMVVEKWADLPALTAHLRAPHMKVYRERVQAFVLQTSILVLEPAGEPG